MQRHSSHLSFVTLRAFSRVEAVVAAGIMAALILIAIPACQRRSGSSPAERADLAEALAHMQRLQQVSAQMAHDGVTSTTNHKLAWPGDLKGSFQEWASNLVENKYLTGSELAKLLSAPGRKLPEDVTPFANNAPVLVYSVADSSLPAVVFLTTDNFINTRNGGMADSTSTSKWGPDFAIVRKDGSGGVFKPDTIGQTNLIGGFTPLCH